MPPTDVVYEFGTVLQHTTRHEIIWLVLTPISTPSGGIDYYAMRLDDDPDGRRERGRVLTIGGATDEKGIPNWNVLEVIRAY